MATYAEQHPLASITEAIGTWTRWKEQWNATTIAENKSSLLHCGFMVEPKSEEESIERVCFYLDVADGYTTSSHFRIPGESVSDYIRFANPRFLGELMDWGGIRQRVAQKAFQTIVNGLFKNQEKEGSFPSWLWLIRHSVLVDKVLWFFRVDEDEPRRIMNWDTHPSGSGAVYREIVLTFLTEFAMQAWTFECFSRYAGSKDLAIQQQLRERRPQFIEVLWGINELHRLLDPRYELDEACMAKLEELAFRRKLYLPTEKKEESYTRWDDTHRKPTTLAEAHYGKSMPAIVLTHRRIVAQEQERFEKLRELSERRDELEREQAALQTAT